MHQETVSTKILGEYLLLTPRRIRQMTQEGLLKHAQRGGRPLKGRFRLRECVNAYIVFLRKEQRGVHEESYEQARASRMLNG